MKNGEWYMHYKKNKYIFDCVALPVFEFNGKPSELQAIPVALDAHTPDGEIPKEIQLYFYKGVTFIDRHEPHVIYQAEKDQDTEKIWARTVADYFGMVEPEDEPPTNRFTKIE